MTTTIHHSLHSRADAGAVNDTTDPDPEVPERAKRRTYSARYKLDILTMYDTADRAGRGALLRREGLYTSHIAEWRKQRDRGAFEALSQKKRGRTGTDWSWHGLTDIHQKARGAGEDAHHGDHGAEQAP